MLEGTQLGSLIHWDLHIVLEVSMDSNMDLNVMKRTSARKKLKVV
jgi:hypothetical protein